MWVDNMRQKAMPYGGISLQNVSKGDNYLQDLPAEHVPLAYIELDHFGLTEPTAFLNQIFCRFALIFFKGNSVHVKGIMSLSLLKTGSFFFFNRLLTSCLYKLYAFLNPFGRFFFANEDCISFPGRDLKHYTN